MRAARLLPALLAGALALLACGEGASGPSSSAVVGAGSGEAALLISAPAGFGTRLDSGLSLQSASAATPAAPTATQQALRGGGFSSGQERVWTRGGEYVTDLVVQLSTDIDAAGFVRFEVGQIGASPAAQAGPLTSIPGASAFGLFGFTRQGSRQTFCSGVWFPYAREAFELLDCSGAPPYPNFVQTLAQQQYARVSGQGQ